MNKVYIIGIKTNDSEEVRYLTRDEFTDYWQKNFMKAITFKTFEEAKNYLKQSRFTETIEMNSGQIFPPLYLQSGLQLGYNTPSRSGVLIIQQVIVSTEKLFPVKATLPCKSNDKFFEL